MKKFIVTTLLIIGAILTLMVSCAPKECTKKATKQKITSNIWSKSASALKVTEWFPSTQQTPIIMNHLKYDSINNRVVASAHIQSDGEYAAISWVGFPQEITIQEGDTLTLISVNAIITGNVNGTGTIKLTGHKSQLIIDGEVSSNIKTIVEEGCSITINSTLSDPGWLPSDKFIIEVDCDFELPSIVRDENGVNWLYEVYDGAGVRLDAGTYKGKL